MGETNWYEHEQFIADNVQKLEEAQAAYALREAWKRVYGVCPSDNSLAVLWAKSALETGRWKHIHNYNFGNIKKKRASKYSKDDGHYFTMYECGEVINGKHIIFKPPHYQTHFRAYLTVEDGAEDYIRFVSQNSYKKAWQKVIEGDPKGYSHELKVAGYYTANEEIYTAGVVRLFDEFLKRKEELMSWIPDRNDTDPSPPPEIEPSEEGDVEDIDVHDTDHNINQPVDDTDTEVDNEIPDDDDTDIDNEIPNPPADLPTRKTLVGMTIAIAFIGSALMWLFDSCF